MLKKMHTIKKYQMGRHIKSILIQLIWIAWVCITTNFKSKTIKQNGTETCLFKLAISLLEKWSGSRNVDHKHYVSSLDMKINDFIPCSVLTLASDWLRTVKYIIHVSYLTLNGISVRYKKKGTSSMTSKWWSPPPSTFPAAAMRLSMCLYNDLGQIKGTAGILKLRKRFSMWQQEQSETA